MYFTGRRVGADEGLAPGLFDEVVADAALLARAQTMAAGIAAGPQIALRDTKEHLNRALQVDLRCALALEADRLVRCARTEASRQGPPGPADQGLSGANVKQPRTEGQPMPICDAPVDSPWPAAAGGQ